ncbi:hypothetical protein HPS54_07680 [Prevotella sp. PCHR]|uniref:Uncharacterized protein n=1 Tax=Xylanibacter caecicola TaxID=2736294 RepID=A0ABX2B3J3_9BACT|nr:hypothetical protein [Xylanibacter caecicola]NPE25388.1 hypothetical protein [Xylanibacter caecicola]
MKRTHNIKGMDSADYFKTRSLLSYKRRRKISLILFRTMIFIAIIIVIMSVISTFVEI